MKIAAQLVPEAGRQRPLFHRSIVLLSLGGAMGFLLALTGMVFLSWLDFQRLAPVREYLYFYDELERVALSWEHTLLRKPSERTSAVDAALTELTRKLERHAGHAKDLEPETTQRLLQLTELFAQIAKEDTSEPVSALESLLDLREAIKQETQALRGFIDDRYRKAREIWLFSVALATFLAAFTGIGLVIGYLRLVKPLQNLGYLMELIGRRSYATAGMQGVDPVLQPLFARYNEMINRLTVLESEHQAREETLEHKVTQATRALMQQHAALMRVERLAATGEVAASLAHELRNPLAGTLSALTNLAGEVQDGEQRKRLELILVEVKRMARLLNNILDQARHRPELATEIDLPKSIHTLVELVRYQIPESIRLEVDVPDPLFCRLPEHRFHQALLNLILNASQAIGEHEGTIRLAVRRSGAHLTIDVCDDGPGFPPELLKQGPQAFFSQRQDGTGLGLVSVQRLAKDLGGELKLQNPEPHGACASMVLPYLEVGHE
jgi:signal transduction histidine kinase